MINAPIFTINNEKNGGGWGQGGRDGDGDIAGASLPAAYSSARYRTGIMRVLCE